MWTIFDFEGYWTRTELYIFQEDMARSHDHLHSVRGIPHAGVDRIRRPLTILGDLSGFRIISPHLTSAAGLRGQLNEAAELIGATGSGSAVCKDSVSLIVIDG